MLKVAPVGIFTEGLAALKLSIEVRNSNLNSKYLAF
jgi:hypothetical protein